MHNLQTPLTTQDLAKLKPGQQVLLTGTIFTARDRAHQWLVKNDFPKIKNGVIYHCGPLVKRVDNKYEIISAGPTTSRRMSIYVPKMIKKYGIKAIIGKGGLDEEAAKSRHGQAIYLEAIGGAGLVYAQSIKQVKNVHHLEWGMPEAIWELEVQGMPLFVG